MINSVKRDGRGLALMCEDLAELVPSLFTDYFAKQEKSPNENPFLPWKLCVQGCLPSGVARP